MTTTETAPISSGGDWGSSNGPAYIRPVRPTGDRPPLICFFPGEPGAQGLAEFLPDNQPIYEFREPNMDGMSVFPTIEEIALRFLQDVRKIQPRGPYQLCGYSAIGLVAYEMARLLDAQGENVSFLCLFDIWHPQFRKRLKPRDLRRYVIMRTAVRLKKYARFVRNHKYREFAESLREVSRRLAWRVMRLMYRSANRAVPKAMHITESVASHMSHTPMPYPKRLVLIRPTDMFTKMLSDPAVGWHHCVTGGVDVHFIPGEHGDIVHSPGVRALVEKIAPYLARGPRESEQTGAGHA